MADVVRVGDRAHARQVHVAFRASDQQTPRLHRIEVRPACQECAIGPGRGKPPAEVATDTASANDCDSHPRMLVQELSHKPGSHPRTKVQEEKRSWRIAEDALAKMHECTNAKMQTDSLDISGRLA